MDGLIVLGLIVAAIVALDISALRWGAESRYGFEERPDRTTLRTL